MKRGCGMVRCAVSLMPMTWTACLLWRLPEPVPATRSESTERNSAGPTSLSDLCHEGISWWNWLPVFEYFRDVIYICCYGILGICFPVVVLKPLNTACNNHIGVS